MKVCEVCGKEIFTKHGDNRCKQCDIVPFGVPKFKQAARRMREQAMRDCGLVKVKGILGGEYWE